MSEFYRKLADEVRARFGDALVACDAAGDELTAVVRREHLIEVCTALRDEAPFRFEQLMDLCGVDYSEYGMGAWQGERFAAVYHLLSVAHNQRIRLRCFAEGDPAILPSVVDVWNSANWYEREAFDLYGLVFEGHPDLRRILTDYGFVGHPFRKDFPLIGHVEMRYDPERQRVVYQPVSIEPRVLVPRVIRRDHRYLDPEQNAPATRQAR